MQRRLTVTAALAVILASSSALAGMDEARCWINDSDLIGTHSRLQLAVNLTDRMGGEGKDVSLPTLDVDDFIGKSFTTGCNSRTAMATSLACP